MHAPTRTRASLILRPAASLAVAALLLLAVSPLLAAEGESYAGFDLDELAEALAQLTTLRTQHGEKQGGVEFDRWLATKGRTHRDYDKAYAAWWERFDADPTGQLMARFHRINSEYVQRLNYADAPDRRGEVREGVSLDDYARIAVALSKAAAGDQERVLRQNGIPSLAKWAKVNEAWAAAMKEGGPTGELIVQYGALYAKHAGPGFADAQEAQVARALAEHKGDAAPRPATPPAPPTLDAQRARLADPAPRERFGAAREILRQCDLWAGPGRRDPKDPKASLCQEQALRKDVLPVVVDAIEHHDDDTISYATNMLDFLDDLGLKDDELEMSVTRARKRIASRLATLQASFAPIKDKAVPERIVLRTRIDEHAAALEELDRALAGW